MSAVEVKKGVKETLAGTLQGSLLNEVDASRSDGDSESLMESPKWCWGCVPTGAKVVSSASGCVLEGKGTAIYFFPLPPGWNATVMAGAGAAILGH